VAVVGVKGAGSEAQRWEAKESLSLKTKDHQLEGSLCFEVVAVVGTSTQAVAWLEDVQESVGQATVAKHTPFLVARSEYSDYPLVRSSQPFGPVLAARCTDADNDEESSVAGEHNSAAGRIVVDWQSQFQSLRRGTR